MMGFQSFRMASRITQGNGGYEHDQKRTGSTFGELCP